MKLVPKKTFLLRQEGEGKRKKDIVAQKGIAIDVTDAEAVKFYGYFDFETPKSGEEDKKKVMRVARQNRSLLRMV